MVIGDTALTQGRSPGGADGCGGCSPVVKFEDQISIGTPVLPMIAEGRHRSTVPASAARDTHQHVR